MEKVYVCFRQWYGDRADTNGDYVGNMVVLNNEDKAIAWLTKEVETEFEIAEKNYDTIVFDKNNPCVKFGGSVDYEMARTELRANLGFFVRVYDEYHENYDSYSEIVIEIKDVE